MFRLKQEEHISVSSSNSFKSSDQKKLIVGLFLIFIVFEIVWRNFYSFAEKLTDSVSSRTYS